MTDDLDQLVHEHLARMPDSTLTLLDPHIGRDAPDPWLRDALLAYLRYFVRVFDRDEPRGPAESLLANDLTKLTNAASSGNDDADITTAEAQLMAGFVERGVRFLGGRTPPYLGAYIWSRTEVRRFSVTLPRAAPEVVTVHFCHDFLIRGWLHWQSFGAQGAGGWYQQANPDWPDGLYCVAERYPEPLEENRSFQVSLLGHEAQYVADHHAFPGLSSAELEYRAKLVELIGFETVDDRPRFFVTDAVDDPERPHPYAAYLIVSGLGERLLDGGVDGAAWDAVPYAAIQREAEALLDEDSARLSASV